ncbi:MAG: glycoside hydrolase family 1 protein [Anaerolineaceae bacterium]
MSEATVHFPRGFLWGTATAAHQVEGNNTNNNWSAWENTPGKIVEDQKAGLACDWWGGRWKEDFDRAQETGQNAHRFSVEWSRIQPTPDTWDDEALNQYAEMARDLAHRGMTPLVTLHHFTDPHWLTEMGGWENPETPKLFAAFVSRVVDALKDTVNLWITINEPNVYVISGWLEGTFPPGKHDLNLAAKVYANLVLGHALAYRVLHEHQPEAQVGTAINYRGLQPARNWMPLDKTLCRIQTQIFNNAFTGALTSGVLDLVIKKIKIPEAARTQDFIGVNYYTRDMVKFDLGAPNILFGRRYFPEGAEVSPSGFIANVPDGMYESLKWAHAYNLPILVTENGVEDHLDTLRPKYLVEHIHQMWRAANFNWRIKGYFHWSLVDNFEWERGWTQRFGLWGLDTVTQERIRRPSVDLYAEICRENGLSSEMVRKYAPDSLEKVFPQV